MLGPPCATRLRDHPSASAEGESQAFGAMMAELGLVHQTWPLQTLPAFCQNSGLAVYSRLPLGEERHGTFEQRRLISAKGWTEVTVELPGSRLVLMNAHLEHAHTEYWRGIRRHQGEQLAKRARDMVAQESSHGGGLVAVVGDFNIGEHAPWQRFQCGTTEYAALSGALRSAGLRKDLFADEGKQPPTMRLEPEHPTFSPDHIFATDALVERVLHAAVVDTRGDSGLPVSDHLGLLVDIRA